jgi:putative acetyltransferase
MNQPTTLKDNPCWLGMPDPRDTGAIEIVPFHDEHAAAFYQLNRAWLDAHALYEAEDERQLAHPRKEILDAGGAIFVAVERGMVVATAAMIPHGPGELEMAKVTVAAAARGRGLGRRLVDHCLAYARRVGARRVVLVSSTRLEAALRLYEAMGFVHRPLPAALPYATADVYMERDMELDVVGPA